MITVEYLLPFNTENGICENLDSFKSLISSNSKFQLKVEKIYYKGSSYDFKIELTQVSEKQCSVYHVSFAINCVTDKFREMLKAFRKTVGVHLKDNIQIIWDGVSFEWSKKLYPCIYQVENDLRMLISKFMLTKLGIGWQKSVVPKDVTESIKEKNYKPTHSILYDVDFIQLANFLFEQYSLKDPNDLSKLLNDIISDGLDEEKKNEILEYLPKNNWDRYFSNIVDCESEELKKKWELLYDIRCKVAHNKSMLIEDFQKAKSLCMELGDIFDKALVGIGKIEIPEEDKENISLKTMATINESTYQFVKNYFKFNDNVSSIISKNLGISNVISPLNSAFSLLRDTTFINKHNIPDNIISNIDSIISTKNNLLSGNINFVQLSKSLNTDLFSKTIDNLSNVSQVNEEKEKGDKDKKKEK